MISIVIQWGRDEDIDTAIEVRRAIVEILREKGLYMGHMWTNDPLKTFRIPLKEAQLKSETTEEVNTK